MYDNYKLLACELLPIMLVHGMWWRMPDNCFVAYFRIARNWTFPSKLISCTNAQSVINILMKYFLLVTAFKQSLRQNKNSNETTS